MGMRKEHLTSDELEALARGEETDGGVESHLRTCAACREAAREGTFATRYVRPLAAGHPDENVLTALWSHALAPAREAEIEAHVSTCSRCQALLARVRRATPAGSSPERHSEHALERTKAWAVASTGPRRATLIARAVEGLKRMRLELLAIASSLEVGDLRPQPEAGSERATRNAVLSWIGRSRNMEYSREPGSGSRDEQADVEASVLNDGKRSFRFEVRSEGTAARLIVTSLVARGGAEAAPVDLVLDAPGVALQTASVGRRGTATFDLAPGRSRLRIGTKPPWEIEIRLDT